MTFYQCLLVSQGSGKTTLLDVLADRVDRSGKGRAVTGAITVKPGTRMRYVPQEDSLCGILTVRETLTMATKLAGTTPDSRVEELLDELGLRVCQATKVGTIFFKGISGGQKRRLSIAVELVTSPSLILLDEPTSGVWQHAQTSWHQRRTKDYLPPLYTKPSILRNKPPCLFLLLFLLL